MASIKDLTELVISADIEKVKETTAALLAAGEDPLKLINEGLIPGINEVGERFKEGNLFVPEMMMSAQAMKAGVDLAKEKIEEPIFPTLVLLLSAQ